MGQAKGCLWYRKGKLRDLGNPGTFEPAAIPDAIVWEGQDIEFGVEERDEWEPEEVSDALHQEFFDLIPVQPPSDPAPTRVDDQDGHQPIAGPSNRILNADEGRRIVVEHHTAAAVMKNGETELQRWHHYIQGGRMLDGDGDVEMLDTTPGERFFPFASEMEWRVSQWAIRDGIGQRSLDRLLSIQGVSDMQ
jgi:hypothetical protein